MKPRYKIIQKEIDKIIKEAVFDIEKNKRISNWFDDIYFLDEERGYFVCVNYGEEHDECYLYHRRKKIIGPKDWIRPSKDYKFFAAVDKRGFHEIYEINDDEAIKIFERDFIHDVYDIRYPADYDACLEEELVETYFRIAKDFVNRGVKNVCVYFYYNVYDNTCRAIHIPEEYLK